LGHSGFLIKTKTHCIATDPYEFESSQEKADIILISHSHFDHCDPKSINAIRTNDTVIIAPTDCSGKIGENVEPLLPGEERDIQGLKIKAVEAYNDKRFRSRGVPFHPKGLGVGYLITIEDKIIYHTGDTDFIPEMKQLGHIDVALIPTGGTYTMDNKDAAEATLEVNPNVAIPMHRWDTDPNEFRKSVESKSKTKVVILNKGETYQVA